MWHPLVGESGFCLLLNMGCIAGVEARREEELAHMLPRYLYTNGPQPFWFCGPGRGGEREEMVQCEWQACTLAQMELRARAHLLFAGPGSEQTGRGPVASRSLGVGDPCPMPYNEQKQSSSIGSQRQMFEIQC